MRRNLSLLLAIGLAGAIPFLMGPASARSYVSGNYSLTLDGVNTGFVKSVEGGSIYAEVIQEPAGADYVVRKHIGQPKYEDFTAQIGFSMAKPVYDWISQSWKGNYLRKNGSVVAMDYNMKASSERQFYNALLTEVTIPACDGSSKEPAYLTLKFAPEYTRMVKADATKSAAPSPGPKGEQKAWIPSNFRLEIDGLDTTRVNKIDAFTVKQKVVQDRVGDARDQVKEPGKLEFPNLTLTVSTASIDAWNGWFDDFVVKGNNGQANEKNGTLYFLATDRQTVLASVKLYNIGIIRLEEDATASNADQISQFRAELYVERMEFAYPSPAKAG